MATRSRTSKAASPQAAPVTPEQALLTAIHDDPDDSAPRLAWADWLTGQGNPWGEVVRTAVRLAEKGRPPSPALRAAEFKHLADGLGPLAGLFSDEKGDVTFDRGTLSGGALLHGPIDRGLIGDPRWRGVRWLHMVDTRTPTELLRGASLDTLAELRNIPVGDLPALATLPPAARLRSLATFAHEEHLSLLAPSLLEPFTAIERFELSDLTSGDEPDSGKRLYGWPWKSRRARAQLRLLAGLPDEMLAEILRQAPRLAALEAVRTDSIEVVLAEGGAHLFLFGTSAFLEEQIAAMKIPPGAVASIAIDAREADRRRNGRASLKAIAAQLGARLTIHAKPAFREHLARWRGEDEQEREGAGG